MCPQRVVLPDGLPALHLSRLIPLQAAAVVLVVVEVIMCSRPAGVKLRAQLAIGLLAVADCLVEISQ